MTRFTKLSGMPGRIGLLLGLAAIAGCSGENLFSLAATTGAGAPVVTITTPPPEFTIPLGDSIPIIAEVNSPVGGSAVIYRGTYASGLPAYVEEPANMNGINVATLRTYLRPVSGQSPGEVWIAVEVSDLAGGIGADSVRVTILDP